MKISCMNLTNRYGGIDILWANMKRQTEQDFELVLVDALWREREEEVKRYINDDRLVYVRQSDKREGAYTNLAHADNEGFRNCKGEIIVCLQDYIWIPHDSFEKFYFWYTKMGKALITGVGDQYRVPSERSIVDEKGKITVFKEPYKIKPEEVMWADPRKRTDQGTFYEGYPSDWELNYCMIPRSIIYELGGMDEEYDYQGHAFDNVNIAARAYILGYKTYLDQTNECRGFNHDGWWPNPLKVNKISPMEFHQQRMKDIVEGKHPIKEKALLEEV